MNEELFYRCLKCGNVAALVKSGRSTLICCGQEMAKLKANSTDAAREKHMPILAIESGKIKVNVGAATHPMTAGHFIEWIARVADNKMEIVHLKPGMEPKATFTDNSEEDKIAFTGENDDIVPNCEAKPCNFVYSENTAKVVAVYAYCNLHGLWETEL